MNKFLSSARSLGVVLLSVGVSASSSAWSFTEGDFFATSPFGTEINRYSQAGTFIESLAVPSTLGDSTKGLSFGPNGKLYAVMSTSSGYNVITVDSAGSFSNVASGSTYVEGNLSYGKIGFAPTGGFYVAGQNDLISFAPGSSTGTPIFTDNQIYDMKVLPSGNLFVLTAYSIKEITSTGSFVRTVNSSIGLTDARGLEYNSATNDLFVTVLGNSGSGYSQTMRLDATTGIVEATTTFSYGDDIALTKTGQVVIGSRTDAPRIFDSNLNQIGSIGTTPQMFVTQFSAPVPEPASVLALGLGGLALLRRKRSRL